MYLVLMCVLCALGFAALIVAASGIPAWWLLPLFLLGFVLAHAVYVLVVWLFARRTDRSRPIEKQDPLCRAATAAACRALCFYGGLRIHLSGLDKLPPENFLLVSNHRSLFDPLLVIGSMAEYNIAFVSKPSNLAIPLIGDVVYAAGFLAIDRENNRKALSTILQAADYLKRGVCSMAIYPEGTRSREGKLLPFHAGSFKIAQRAGVPLVIACVRGTEQVKHRLPFRRTDVYFDVLETIPAEQVKALSTNELSHYSRELMEKVTGSSGA